MLIRVARRASTRHLLLRIEIAAVQVVAEYCGDRGLTLNGVAPEVSRRIGFAVSTRQLQRAFEESGTSFSAVLRETRLKRALVLLNVDTERVRLRLLRSPIAWGTALDRHSRRHFRPVSACPRIACDGWRDRGA